MNKEIIFNKVAIIEGKKMKKEGALPCFFIYFSVKASFTK